MLGTLPQLTDKQASGLNSLPWELTSSVSASEKIMISVPDAQCYDVIGSQTRTTATAVTIAVWGRHAVCKATTVSVIVLVQISEPIGTRTLTHAPVTTVSSKPPE